jgi:hypothetical protein
MRTRRREEEIDLQSFKAGKAHTLDTLRDSVDIYTMKKAILRSVSSDEVVRLSVAQAPFVLFVSERNYVPDALAIM